MITRNSVGGGAYPVRTLGEVVEFLDSKRRPVTESDRQAGSYPYYGANGKQGTIDNYIFDEPLVLLAEDGGHFDAPERGIAYRISGKTWVNNHAHVLRPKQGLELGFLCRVLENYDVKPFVTGTTRGKLTKAGASEILIPLPPLPEQIRIAAILDKADALRVKRREALAQLDSLTQAIFIDMFGDPIANPFKFPLLPIAKLVSNGRGQNIEHDEQIWNLNLDQIEPHTGRVLQKVRSDSDKLGTSTFSFHKGTVLFSKLRPYLNKVVVADEDGVATTELVPLKCIETLTKPIFLAYFLRSKRFVDFATGTVAGAKMPRMMMDAFWSYQLPLPPVLLQDSFADKISRIEKQRNIQLQSANEFDNLFASLQHRAFRGEL